jgi:uncharacterized membrane protein YdcZ (DUF606 family)
MTEHATGRARNDFVIWWFAFGYFACYAPYSALTKALTKPPRGLLTGMSRAISSFELLPSTVLASLIGMFVFLSAMRWWRYASKSKVLGFEMRHPTRWTFLSGLCTAAIIMTTTLAYTFKGVSIVFVMLLMRGGVLVLAPVIDAFTGRRVRWFSWAGFVLSLLSLVVAFAQDRGSYDITLLCGVDVAIYLASYFVRLRFMSRLAKSDDPDQSRRFFVEEQMTATPAAVLVLAIAALVGYGGVMREIRAGFTTFWSEPVVMHAIVIGLLSQGTGIFGGLILLDRRENTYCVPVNRCSSVLAGVVASYGLTTLLGQAPPNPKELLGASLIVGAILFLTLPLLLEKRRARAA